MWPRKCGLRMPVSMGDPESCTTSRVTQSAATRLRLARHRAGLTQEATAVLVGCGLRTVQRRELGEVDLGPLEQLIVLEQAAGKAAA